jgi:hypothetical protein
MQITFNSSLSSAKEFAKLMKFATIREYSKYVNENSLSFKANPSEYKGYVSAADFLGMTISDYKASKVIAQVMNRDQVEINRKLSLTWAKKRADKRAKVNTLQTQLPLTTQVIKAPVTIGLDPDKVISFLIDENVEPDTIVKMIAELEISSGTLMAELCKYMTKKTLEKQATWRPTGYNTSEAQMSLKM